MSRPWLTLATVGVAAATLAWAKWYPYALKIPVVADSLTRWGTPSCPGRGARRRHRRDLGRRLRNRLRRVDLAGARCRPARGSGGRGISSGTPAACAVSDAAQLGGEHGLRRPWQFGVVRAGTGVVLVFGVTLLVSRLAKASNLHAGPEEETVETGTAAGAALRFAKALVRLAVRLLPEYAVVVMLLGGFRGWLFPAGSTLAAWGWLAAVLLAVVGTLFVIPTAAEIPIIGALMAAGVGMVPLGALVLTLPALSLPSMLMVRGAFPGRVIVAVGFAVMGLGVTGALAMAALT